MVVVGSGVGGRMEEVRMRTRTKCGDMQVGRKEDDGKTKTCGRRESSSFGDVQFSPIPFVLLNFLFICFLINE